MGIEVILSNSANLENTYDAFEYIQGMEIELSEIIGRKVDLRTPEDLSRIEGVRESIVLAIQEIEQSTPLLPRQRGTTEQEP